MDSHVKLYYIKTVAEYLDSNPTPAFLKHNASASASNARTGQANRIDAKHSKENAR